MSNPFRPPSIDLPSNLLGPATPPAPETSPVLALARGVMEDPGPSAINRQIIELDAARNQARRDSLFERQERMELHEAMAEAMARAEHIQTQQALRVLKDRNKSVRDIHYQMVEARMKEPVQQDIAQSLGIPSSSHGDPTDQGTEETPMTQKAAEISIPSFSDVWTKASEGALVDANLVGFQDDADSPLTELYLQDTLPTWKERAARAGLYGSGAGVLGAGLGAASNKLLNGVVRRLNGNRGLKNLVHQATSRRLMAGGALLGGLAGGLAGGLSNRPIRHAYDTSTGESASWAQAAKGREIVQALKPTEQPGNFVVANPGDLASLGDQEPLFAYASDVDDLAQENPEFFADM